MGIPGRVLPPTPNSGSLGFILDTLVLLRKKSTYYMSLQNVPSNRELARGWAHWVLVTCSL